MSEENDTPAPERKKMRRLTPKQAKLARARVKNPEATLSELGQMADYDNPANVKRALDAEHVQDRVRRLMDANPNLTTAALTKKLAEGLEAKVTKFATFEGKITDEKEYVDLPTRHRYLETAAEWRGIAEKRIKMSSDREPPMTLEQALAVLKQAQCLPPEK